MRKVVLVGIITILLLVPTSGLLTGNAGAITGGASHPEYYNFTSLKVGTQPANKSWVHFSTLNPSSTFADSVQNSKLGRGFRIYNDNYTSASFLKLNLTGNNSYELHMEFSWYYSYVKGLTNNSISFSSDGMKLFSLAIGPTDMETILSNVSNSTSLGKMMPYSSLISLDVFFNSSHNHAVFIKLQRTGSGILSFPIKETFPSAAAGNITMEIGGNYANVTLYNVSEISTGNDHVIHASGSGIQYNSSHFALSSGFHTNVSSAVQPRIDQKVNGVIYYTAENRLAEYNYYNSSYRNLSEPLKGLSGGIAYGNSVYYWQDGKNLTVFALNESTLALSKFPAVSFSGAHVSVIFNGDTALFYNTSGNMLKENLSSHQVVFSGVLDFSNHPGGFRLLSAGLKSNSLVFEGYSNNSGEISAVNYSFPSMTRSSHGVYNYSTLNGGITVGSSVTGSRSQESLFSVKNNVSQNYIAASSGRYITSSWNQNLTGLLAEGSNLTLASSAESIVLIGQNNSFAATGISSNKTGRDKWSISNTSELLEMTQSSFAIYYSGPSLPLSNYGLKIEAKTTYLLQGNTTLNVGVESSLSYSISLSVYHVNINLHNSSDFFIDTSLLQEGNNTATLRATNEAGYTSNIAVVLEVDNIVPSVTVMPGNNSYISNSTKVAFNASDTLGINSITVYLLKENIFFSYSNGSFLVRAKNVTGTINVTFQVEDGYGLTFNTTFSYIIPAFNSSSRMNIWNGEYLAKKNLNLTWTPEQNITSYALRVKGKSGSYNFSTSYNYSDISFGNGNVTVELYANLVDGKTILLSEANITVIAFDPSVSVLQYPSGIYSFAGNSANDHFTARIDSNISSILAVTLYSPSGTPVYSANSSRNFVLNFSNIAGDLLANGKYVLTYNATSPSGTYSQGELGITVNNSIPKAPVTGNSLVYTNYSTVGIYLQQEPGLNYTATIKLGQMQSSIGIIGLDHLGLPFGTGNYTLNITTYSDSGNYNSTLIAIDYHNQTPVISMSVQKRLVQTNYTVLHYSISDDAPMQSITLDRNGTYVPLGLQNSEVNLSFKRNGIYNISILVKDKCGNSNNSNKVPVNVSYFIYLKSPHIIASHSANGWSFYISSQGNGIGRVSMKWYVDGNEVSNGSRLNTSLGLGIHTVRTVLTFQGHKIVVSKKVYVLGWIPYALAGAVSAVVAVQRVFLVSRDVDEARKVVMESINLSLSDAIRAGRKKRLTSGTVRKAAFIMKREGKISIQLDPDGKRFIMEPGWDRK